MDDVKELIARLSRLERSARRWRIATAAALVVLAVVVGGGALAGPGSIEATMLKIVDKQGRDRIVMATSGGATEGTHLAFLDSDGKAQLQVMTKDDGYTVVGFRDTKTKKIRFQLGIHEDGAPFIYMLDEDGKRTFRAP